MRASDIAGAAASAGVERAAQDAELSLLGRPLRVAPDPDRQMVAAARNRPSVLA